MHKNHRNDQTKTYSNLKIFTHLDAMHSASFLMRIKKTELKKLNLFLQQYYYYYTTISINAILHLQEDIFDNIIFYSTLTVKIQHEEQEAEAKIFDPRIFRAFGFSFTTNQQKTEILEKIFSGKYNGPKVLDHLATVRPSQTI